MPMANVVDQSLIHLLLCIGELHHADSATSAKEMVEELFVYVITRP